MCLMNWTYLVYSTHPPWFWMMVWELVFGSPRRHARLPHDQQWCPVDVHHVGL